MELIKLGKRKITARKYSQVDEGKLKVLTPKGWVRPSHGDYLMPIDKTTTLIINGDAMEYLMKKDDKDEQSFEPSQESVELDEHIDA